MRRFLSNGRYSALITERGTGYSRYGDLLLTAWTSDRTEDGEGLFIYVRDVERGHIWSIGRHPTGGTPDSYTASYEPACHRIVRREHDIEAEMQTWVAADDPIEIRTLRLRNHSSAPRTIEITTYAEVVLNYAPAHAAHPAFSKLFVETEYDAGNQTLLARRRPRSATEHWPLLVHALRGDGALEYDTDRATFLGRNHSLARPFAVAADSLAGHVGSVLDPVVSMRRRVTLAPGGEAELFALLGAAETRADADALTARYRDGATLQTSRRRAAEHEQQLLGTLALSAADADHLHEIGGAMLYDDAQLRAPAELLTRTEGTLSDLYQYSMRLDWMTAVAHVDRREQDAAVRNVVNAHAYWQAKGLSIQLVLLCDGPAALADWVRETFAQKDATRLALHRAALPAHHVDLLKTFARLIVPRLDDGGLANVTATPAADSSVALRTAQTRTADVDKTDIQLFNGVGGFTPDGNEYVMRLATTGASDGPPMPWVNVVSNERFGFLVSETGAGYTWSRNSRENRLTPWFNDPIRDPSGEALYLRDDADGTCWSPQPAPAPDGGTYEARHGFGFSRWRHISGDLEQHVWQFVPMHDPVKIVRLTLRNRGTQARTLSVYSYHRLVLGVLPEDSARLTVTSFDTETKAIFARNRLNNEFNDGVVFAAAVPPTGAIQSYTADRTAFIGAGSTAALPAALARDALDGKTGAGLDPCAALQVKFQVAAGATVECAFLLGETTSEDSARQLIARYRAAGAIEAARADVQRFWNETVSAVHVQTPSPAIDLMLNGWLLYQVLSCRIWGRSAFYQSGGALGFRDQLQDAAALTYARPDLTRAQLLLHAGHQFVEGDVLHWWHPPTNRGIRTRFSDDLLWLAYVTTVYIDRTGDTGVLDENAEFLTTRALNPGEDEAYLYPAASGEHADLYTHCCRALDRSLTRGAHGIPLMGTGDWNDGMNRVGREGRGESVWLGFFLSHILDAFVPHCERRGDRERVERYRAYQRDLTNALETAGWDGEWYRRAYYDDGTPLGTASASECQIDAIAQAWAVISKVASPAHAAAAMASVERMLIASDAGLIRLLTPPFDKDAHDPGYIKGYVPGIRENGGQYTHGAMWVVEAFAELRRRDRAAALLEMLSPVTHAHNLDRVGIYQVEPYVIAADIYGVVPHVGRGGWTWYTGSAAWMYRIGLEAVLGVRVEHGNLLRINPCIPDDWPEFRVSYRAADGKTRYEIVVRNPARKAIAVQSATVDGRSVTSDETGVHIPLATDGGLHRVEVTLG